VVAAALLALSLHPLTKGECIALAEAKMAKLGFVTPRAYGAWRYDGYWRISLRDRRQRRLEGWIEPTSGFLVYAINRDRWPRDATSTASTRSIPRSELERRLVQSAGPQTRLAAVRHGWGNHLEAWGRVYVGSRRVVSERKMVTPMLIVDDVTGEPILFQGLRFQIAVANTHAHISAAAAAETARRTMAEGDEQRRWIKAGASPGAIAHPTLSTPEPVLFLSSGGTGVPAWQVSVTLPAVSRRHRLRLGREVFVAESDGRVLSVSPSYR
jgi:hypothetical protein